MFPITCRFVDACTTLDLLNSGFVEPILGAVEMQDGQLLALSGMSLTFFNKCSESLSTVLDLLHVPHELRELKGLNHLFRDVPPLLPRPFGEPRPPAIVAQTLAPGTQPAGRPVLELSRLDHRTVALKDQVSHLLRKLGKGLETAGGQQDWAPLALLQHGRSTLAELEVLREDLAQSVQFDRELDDRVRHLKVETQTWLVHLRDFTSRSVMPDDIQKHVDAVRCKWRDSQVFEPDLGLPGRRRLAQSPSEASTMTLGALQSLGEACGSTTDAFTTRKLEQLEAQVKFQIRDRMLDELAHVCIRVANATGLASETDYGRLQDLILLASEGLSMDLERARLQHPGCPDACALKVLPGALQELAQYRSSSILSGGAALLASEQASPRPVSVAFAGVGLFDVQNWLSISDRSVSDRISCEATIGKLLQFLQAVNDRRSRVEDAVRSKAPVSFIVEPPSLLLVDLICLFFPGNKAALAETLLAQVALDAWMIEGSDPPATEQSGLSVRFHNVPYYDGLFGLDSIRSPSGQNLLQSRFLEGAVDRMVNCAQRLAKSVRAGAAKPPVFASIRDCIPLSMGVAVVGISWVFGALCAAFGNCEDERDLLVSTRKFVGCLPTNLQAFCWPRAK
jgi:hypothetical protein